jgi:putative membrane protein
MTPWPARETFDIAVIGKRLAMLLLGVTAYYLASGYLLLSFHLPGIQRVGAESLINTVILGLLMGFRNRAAYGRWWEGRSLWGKLVNDSRNFAAKSAAFVPPEALSTSGVADILIGFPEALKRHLRGESFHLKDISGFEREQEAPSHVPLYLARRLFAAIASWKGDGHIDQAELWILDGHAAGLLDVCGGCEKIRNTPLSPSYKGFLRTGLALNVLSAPWILIPDSGWASLPVVLLACFFFFGVELIDSIVEEPFGKERDDLDLDRYCKTIEDGVLACLPRAAC